MESLTRALVQAQMMSLIEVFREDDRWDWDLTEIGASITKRRPSEDHDSARFSSRDDALLNAFRWAAALAPELEKAAVAEALHGIQYRAARSGHAEA